MSGVGTVVCEHSLATSTSRLSIGQASNAVASYYHTTTLESLPSDERKGCIFNEQCKASRVYLTSARNSQNSDIIVA